MRTGSYPDSLIAMMSLLVMTMLLVQDYYKTRKTVEVSSVKLCHVCFTQIVIFPLLMSHVYLSYFITTCAYHQFLTPWLVSPTFFMQLLRNLHK